MKPGKKTVMAIWILIAIALASSATTAIANTDVVAVDAGGPR